VVRGRGDRTDGPVAVGVDDSPAADHVLEIAFTAAAARDTDLAVIRTYVPPTPLWLASTVPAADIETPDQDAIERRELNNQLAPWREKFPEVRVETMLSHDSAAAALVRASHRAQLVVVGSRGRGIWPERFSAPPACSCCTTPTARSSSPGRGPLRESSDDRRYRSIRRYGRRRRR
jgi:nucleotide-binding universal stress UspA family protein